MKLENTATIEAEFDEYRYAIEETDSNDLDNSPKTKGKYGDKKVDLA
jgi:hypothetical protein